MNCLPCGAADVALFTNGFQRSDFKAHDMFCTCYKLTPLPGPLPVEGRGSRKGRASRYDSMSPRWLPSGLFRLYNQNATSAAQGVAWNTAACRAPSPLNGERAGVRGEKVRCASPSWVLKATPMNQTVEALSTPRTRSAAVPSRSGHEDGTGLKWFGIAENLNPLRVRTPALRGFENGSVERFFNESVLSAGNYHG